MFAERMNSLSQMEVREAEDGDRVMPGRVLIAPGALHLRVVRAGGQYKAEVKPGELVNGHCPSVEVLMKSVAEQVGPNAIGVMLTGMGRDGAEAMKAMRDAGGRCIAQDEATSVVFGMPKEAYQRGGAERLVPLGNIAQTIMDLLAVMVPS
jgi:two-component system chemotaxis response regulator CheB